ncbi:MAG: endonuclease/exonuclease/phosphatase family protein [Chitinophagaceae bacterium]|nr:MAG: endonuclease/exonuclease/phosphatase family protein [Chitinophagaceae bacterium]
MKVITWNCNMAFRKKAAVILAYEPDILIVPECEHPDNLVFDEGVKKPRQVLWFGNNRHKGLAIFSYSDFTFKLKRNHNAALRMIVPIAVKGGDLDFTLYAVWANNPHDPDGQYVEQVWKAVQHYNKKLGNKQTMLAGDFNSNTIWDKKNRAGNHSNVVKALDEKDIHSCYHFHHQQIQGKEEHPTFYLYRHQDKPYHIDYCFASRDLIDKIASVEIGEFSFWKQYSDHVPVMVTYNSRKIEQPTPQHM